MHTIVSLNILLWLLSATLALATFLPQADAIEHDTKTVTVKSTAPRAANSRDTVRQLPTHSPPALARRMAVLELKRPGCVVSYGFPIRMSNVRLSGMLYIMGREPTRRLIGAKWDHGDHQNMQNMANMAIEEAMEFIVEYERIIIILPTREVDTLGQELTELLARRLPGSPPAFVYPYIEIMQNVLMDYTFEMSFDGWLHQITDCENLVRGEVASQTP